MFEKLIAVTLSAFLVIGNGLLSSLGHDSARVDVTMDIEPPHVSDTLLVKRVSDQVKSNRERQASKASRDAHELVALVDEFIAARHISRRQYQQISELVLADGNIDEQERCQINRLFDAIQTGAIRVID